VNYRIPTRTALILFGILFLLTGLGYPLLITGVAELAFPYQAQGSLIKNEQGIVIGSELIGQNFSGPLYFEGRPSSTADVPYNAAQSGGSNLGPSNPVLLQKVNTTIQHLEVLGMGGPWPGDLVTSSASGLDPHITLDAALLQVPIVAEARGFSEEEVRALVYEHIDPDPFSLDNVYVNVFSLNRALDEE
jgi:K+-transporting ATPase ATPase C chain